MEVEKIEILLYMYIKSNDIQNIVINHKKYSEIMKKVFRKIHQSLLDLR